MVNNQKICGLLGLATRAGKIVAGTDACLQEIEKHNVKLLILAVDSADRTKKVFNEKCKEFNITVYEGLTIDEISNSIGKPNKGIIHAINPIMPRTRDATAIPFLLFLISF